MAVFLPSRFKKKMELTVIFQREAKREGGRWNAGNGDVVHHKSFHGLLPIDSKLFTLSRDQNAKQS